LTYAPLKEWATATLVRASAVPGSSQRENLNFPGDATGLKTDC
jgi:hypothetical protein